MASDVGRGVWWKIVRGLARWTMKTSSGCEEVRSHPEQCGRSGLWRTRFKAATNAPRMAGPKKSRRRAMSVAGEEFVGVVEPVAYGVAEKMAGSETKRKGL